MRSREPRSQWRRVLHSGCLPRRFQRGAAKHQVEIVILGTRVKRDLFSFTPWIFGMFPSLHLEFLNISVVMDLIKNIFKSWLPWHMIQSLEFWQEIQGKLVQKKKNNRTNISGYFTSHPQYFSVSICLTTKHVESFTSWGLCCWVRFQPSIIKKIYSWDPFSTYFSSRPWGNLKITRTHELYSDSWNIYQSFQSFQLINLSSWSHLRQGGGQQIERSDFSFRQSVRWSCPRRPVRVL